MRRSLSTPRLDEAVLTAWQEQLSTAGNTPDLAPDLLQQPELLPRFAAHYTQLRALPRRMRRALQRQWKQSLTGVALLFALGATPGQAATIPVSATCSLVNAIRAANTDTATGGCPRGNGADTIRLPVGSTQTLTTVNNSTFGPTGLPVITSTITIEGNDSTIKRRSNAPTFRILAVGSTGDLTLNETTVSGGTVSGGATGSGGGVFNYSGSLTITNSILLGNSANSGGGVSSVSYHDYGYYIPSLLSIENSTISGNSATVGGGGVENTGHLTITNSTLSGNSTSGSGGGVSTYSGDNPLTIINSTLSGNSATIGGGVDSISNLTIINSTLSGNSASYIGGGVRTVGGNSSLTIINSTLSGNSASYRGGGVYRQTGPLTLTRTLVAGNSANQGPEISGGATVNSFNLFGHDGNAGVTGFTPGATDVVPSQSLTAILNPTLANNGGPTRTHALVPGSPALDAVATGCPPPNTDQRGVARPQGLHCDIGAVEAQGFCIGQMATRVGTPGNDVLTGTPNRDVMLGLSGNDTLLGLGGRDILCGGDGADVLDGGYGLDFLYGERGNDVLHGGNGPDYLYGGEGDDRVYGDAGNDEVRGDAGKDQLFGGTEDDVLHGGPDDDALDGGGGSDTCDGSRHRRGDTALNCEVILNVP